MASSHFRRISVSSAPYSCEFPEDCRRTAVDARRADEDDRRWPAFCSVFCSVISLDSAESRGGLAVAAVDTKPSLVGDELGGPEGPEKEGFLRMPVDGRMWLVVELADCRSSLRRESTEGSQKNTFRTSSHVSWLMERRGVLNGDRHVEDVLVDGRLW